MTIIQDISQPEILIFPTLAGVAVIFFFRSRAILRRWASEHKFEIIHVDRSAAFRSPFKDWYFMYVTQWQTVYHVTIRDSKGHERSCWVRCGVPVFGILFYKTEVIWD